MAENRIAKTIGVDELTESIAIATMRALKSEHPALQLEKTGLAISFRIYCGIPVPEQRLGALAPEIAAE